jgi:hypothetical protein
VNIGEGIGEHIGDMFARRVLETGRLPLLCFFVAFIITFVITRVNVRLIRADVRWWFKNVKLGDLHIHHVVFGVVLMLVGGVASFAIPEGYRGLYAVAAGVFGIGSALVLDEFALILHLRDVYWAEEGRASVDAVCVAVGITGLLLVGVRPVGFTGAGDAAAGPLLGTLIPPGIYVVSLVINLSLAVITLLKGKIWTGLIGLFVPLFVYVGAVRVARPGSPWARWRYPRGSRKYRRALRNEELVRHPIIQAKIWAQEFIAGRHGLITAEHHPRPRRLSRIPQGEHDEPLSEPLPEPLSEPLSEPLPEPLSEPLSEPLPDSLCDALPDALPDPLGDPLSDALPDPLPDPLPEPVPEMRRAS